MRLLTTVPALLALTAASAQAQLDPPQVLISDTPVNFEQTGHGTAIDGHRMVAGAWHADTASGNDTGRVLVFERAADGSWIEADVLVPSQQSNNQYVGRDLALDGDTLLAGGAGGGLLWERSGGTWIERLQVGQLNGGYLGEAVALDGDHGFLGGSYQSSVAVIQRVGGTWTQATAIQNPTGSAVEWFGMALDFDGTTLVAGVPRGQVESRVDVFRLVGGVWTRIQAIPFPGTGPSGAFGEAVAVDGGRIVVGAPDSDDGQPRAGKAYVFEEGPGGYALTAELQASDVTAFAHFGFSVSIDGDHAVCSAPEHFIESDHEGVAYVFSRDAQGGWTEIDRVEATDLVLYSNDFGFDTALADGRLAVGTIGGVPSPGLNCGFVALYDLEGSSTSTDALSVASGGTQAVALDLGPAHAGDLYWLLGSVTGTTPGLPLAPGATLPLAYDAYTDWLLLNANQAPWSGSLGFLNASGSATATFTLSAGALPALAGVTAFHAAAIVDPVSGAVEAATNATSLRFDP